MRNAALASTQNIFMVLVNDNTLTNYHQFKRNESDSIFWKVCSCKPKICNQICIFVFMHIICILNKTGCAQQVYHWVCISLNNISLAW